jgi:hypothetical protein
MSSWRLVTVTPAGRKRYLEILVPYLLKNRQCISEHHFWLNTTNRNDIEYITTVAGTYPDFFKVKRREIFNEKNLPDCIWQYWQDCVEDHTIYVRLDDDICFVDNEAIAKLFEFRQNHPTPFLVCGNVVNNALCSHIHQSLGVIPRSWGEVKFECLDKVGWAQKRFAGSVHRLFVQDVRRDRIERWKFAPRQVDDYRRFSINVVAWFGRDMKKINELKIQDPRTLDLRHPISGETLVNDEEEFFTRYFPAKIGRACVICGDALFSHFAFWTQRPYLDEFTALLDWYSALIHGPVSPVKVAWLRLKDMVKFLGLIGCSWAWSFLIRELRRILTRNLFWLKTGDTK